MAQRPSPEFAWNATQVLIGELGFELPATVAAEITNSIEEMILNAMTHSSSPVGCVLVGQAYPANRVLEVAILDLGCTIRTHLARSLGEMTDIEAIQRACEYGVTGTKGRNIYGEPNSGSGLPVVREFLQGTGGELAILSGSALVSFKDDRCHQHRLLGVPFGGTLVNLTFIARFD